LPTSAPSVPSPPAFLPTSAPSVPSNPAFLPSRMPRLPSSAPFLTQGNRQKWPFWAPEPPKMPKMAVLDRKLATLGAWWRFWAGLGIGLPRPEHYRLVAHPWCCDQNITPANPLLSMAFAGAIVRTRFSLTFSPATDSWQGSQLGFHSWVWPNTYVRQIGDYVW